MAVRRLLSLFAAALLVLAVPGAAQAGKRRVPSGFFGASWDGAARSAPPRARAGEWGAMSRSGVESVRASFNWATAVPHRRDPVGFRATDEIVAQAARHRLRVLPVVELTPVWARRYPDRRASPPAISEDFVEYLVALVFRYGPAGTFWSEHPELRERPIREWQIWNEPELPRAWDVPPGAPDAWPTGYVRLLEVARAAIKSADERARVVMAGLANDSWNKLAQLYAAGGGGLFDVAAFHLYSRSGSNTYRAARLVRRVMRRNGDRRKPLYATEIGCPASRGRLRTDRNFATSDRGMARCVHDAYSSLARKRRWRRLDVRAVYWYTWASRYRGRSLFDYSGLRRLLPGRPRFRSKPALRSYTRLARRYQGCAKTSTARCRRRR
jgi:polysaccharide biosynthesis protein PslG